MILSDGKNLKNLEQCKNKLFAATTTINAIAEAEVLRGIEASVIIELHDKINLSALLTNAESWNLNKTERNLLEKTEIQTVKFLFDLPLHTPTPAILFTFGLLYTGHLLDQKRLIYINKILKRHDLHWTKQAFKELDKLNIGWARDIKSTLRAYDLPVDFDEIAAMTRPAWTRMVKQKIEVSNSKRLLEECHKLTDGVKQPRTKTAHIIGEIMDDTYQRKVREEVVHCTKYEAKTLLIARFGMLECGKNYKGTMKETCATCSVLDDENHRLNSCPMFSSVNNYGKEKVDFNNIFSHDPDVFRDAIRSIGNVWNTRTAHGTMKV